MLTDAERSHRYRLAHLEQVKAADRARHRAHPKIVPACLPCNSSKQDRMPPKPVKLALGI